MQLTLTECTALWSLAFLGFFAYAIAAIGTMPPIEHGYTTHDRQQMERLVAQVTAPQSDAAKIVYLYGEQ